MAAPWTLSALGLLTLAAIVGTSTLSTAYLMRPPSSPPAMADPDTTDLPEPHRPAIVRIAPVTAHRRPAAVVSEPDDRGAADAGRLSPARAAR
jgi:hypothetical protein